MVQGSRRLDHAVALCRFRAIIVRPRQSTHRWSALTPALVAVKCLATATTTPTHSCIELWSMRRAALGAAQALSFSTSPGLDEGSGDRHKGKSSAEQITILVRLSPAGLFEVVDTTGPRVGHLKDDIIAKFKLDAAPQQVQLFKLDGNIRTLLNPAQMLFDTGVFAGTKLDVEIAVKALAAPSDLAIARLAGRKFTVNGAIEPAMAPFFYFLPPDLSKLEQHVVESSFFMLYGPRGGGKTTTALHLQQRVASKYHVRPLKLDFNSLTTGTTRDAFWRSVFRKLRGEAETHSITVAPFDDVAGFVDAMTLRSLGGARVLLMLDEFDKLDHAADGIKEEVLGAVRTIKQGLSSYGVQCVVAVGPFSILFMQGASGSPFNVREAVPVHFFTEDQVSELLGQFATDIGISLDAGIAADIHELTAGHAGLVCACGRALETGGLQHDGHVKLAAWLDFRIRRIIDTVVEWPTIGNMARSVPKMVPSAWLLLEQALFAGNELLELKTRPGDVSEAARYLAAEGWLVAAGSIGAESYRFTSPLVRSLAMRQLARERSHEPAVPLPFVAGTQQLDVVAALRTALPYFRPATMRSVSAFSSKVSTAPAIFKLPTSRLVPNEAVYHFELFSVLQRWLGIWQYADLYPEADVLGGMTTDGGTKHKRYADMLIAPRSSNPKHVLELVASSSAADIIAHYSRTIGYMVVHGTNWGACVTFTAVASAPAASLPSASLVWPEASHLGAGLVAIHVVHDLAWTTATVHWKIIAGEGAFTVDLAA